MNACTDPAKVKITESTKKTGGGGEGGKATDGTVRTGAGEGRGALSRRE